MRGLARIDGIPVFETTLDDAVDDLLMRAAGSGTGKVYRLINAYSLALADRDPRYHRLLSGGGVNLPDGMPLAWALRRLGSPGVAQVRGPSFFLACLDRGRAHDVRHYFLGGTPETLTRLGAAVHAAFPGASVVGLDSPPFRPLDATEREAQQQRIRRAMPDVVWVGLGTPKQDFEAQRICDELGVCAAGVGAAFDFLAGTKREAPRVLTGMGLEWLYRLATEPKRLWRRYLFGNARFMIIAVREGVRRRRSRPA